MRWAAESAARSVAVAERTGGGVQQQGVLARRIDVGASRGAAMTAGRRIGEVSRSSRDATFRARPGGYKRPGSLLRAISLA